MPCCIYMMCMILLFQKEDFATSCIESVGCIAGFGQGSDNTAVVDGTIVSGMRAFSGTLLTQIRYVFKGQKEQIILIGCLSLTSSVIREGVEDS
jgi:hypothetical protein